MTQAPATPELALRSPDEVQRAEREMVSAAHALLSAAQRALFILERDPVIGDEDAVRDLLRAAVYEAQKSAMPKTHAPAISLAKRLCGPHEWGYRCPVEGAWIEDLSPFEAAAALEAQQARIAELEAESAALTKALTGLTCGGSEFFIRKGDRYVADIDACVSWVRRAKEDAHRRTVKAITEQKASQALADRYEKALREALAFYDALRTEHAPGEIELLDRIDQALSSQGRREGVTSGFILELPGVNAVPLPVSPDGPLSDPSFVHLNMLRGGIAKLTPAQIGHLYRGAEAAEVIAEVLRQNPAVQPTDALYGLVNAARRHMATHPVFRTRSIGGEGSRARLEQEDQIASEDALRGAIQAALLPSPDNTNPKAGAPEHG